MSVDLDHATPPPAAPGGPLRVALVIGSVREGRVGCSIARWAATHAERRTDLEIIERVLPLHLANEARLLRSLSEADRRNLATTLAAMLESYGDVPPGVDD